MRWPGTIRAAAGAGSAGRVQTAQAHHHDGHRRRPARPGLRAGRLSARRRSFWAGAESDRCCRGSRRTGSARRRILGAGAEPDTCRRGAGGPGSAHRRRCSGATGRHRRYRRAAPDRGAGQRCSTESVSARLAFGWRQRRRRSIGRFRRYFGAAVRARGTVGWRPCKRRSIARVRCYFGAAVRARGTVGWRPCKRRSIARVRCYFGAGVRARGTVGWRPVQAALHRARPPLLRRRSRRPRYRLDGARAGGAPSRAFFRRYFGAAVGARGTVGWRPCRLRWIGRFPPLLRHRSPRPRHGWMAPVQAALHRALPPLLRRRSRRTRHGWMAPVQAALHRALPPLLRRRSRRTRHGWMAPVQAALHRALSAATSAPQSAHAARLDGARAGGAPSGASAATSAPQSAHAARLDGARAGGAPSGASAATSAPQSAHAARLDGAREGGAPSGASAATSAPEPALGGSPDGGPSSASAGAAAAASAGWLLCAGRRTGLAGRHFGAGARPRRVPRRWTARRISRGSGTPDPRFCPQRPPISASAPHSRGCPAPRLATRRWTLLLSRSALRPALHLFPSAADRPPVARRRGRWPGAVQLGSTLLYSSQNAPRLRPGGAAGTPDVAPSPPRGWRAARLRRPTACRWPGGGTLRSAASPACIFATACSDPGRSLSMRSRAPLSRSPVNDFLPLPAFAPQAMRLIEPAGPAWSDRPRSGEFRAVHLFVKGR